MLKRIAIWLWNAGGWLWLAVNAATTYATLPEDIEEFWRENMMGEPLLPWLVVGTGALLMLWVYYPAFRAWGTVKNERGAVDRSVSIGRDNLAPILTGDVHINPRLEVTDHLVSELVQAIDLSKPVVVASAMDGRSQTLSSELRERLKSAGCNVSSATLQIGSSTAMVYDKPVTIWPNGLPLFGGQEQTVFIDAGVPL
ncbi:hypothetical protein [Tateyamaria sp. syn59]|uniref:hypothetical protein n=1 Tax=Tateyamaria sp. syn59 TaxID=2576942 RepID=UPI0011BF250B|nr:hypothetical protein [Tateyamaria sp. syn59]